MTQKILLIDNDDISRAGVKKALHKQAYQIIETGSLSQALVLARDEQVGLVLLNWCMPVVDELAFIKSLKGEAQTRQSRLLLLAGRDVLEHTVLGMRAGADDYLTRPFTARALVMRARTWLNDSGEQSSAHHELHFASLCLDESSHVTTIDGNLVRLGPTEFRLLNFFMRHPNQAFRRQELIAHVWNDPKVDPRTVDVHIRRLRKALLPYGYDAYLQTVRTIGYRLSNYGVSTRNKMS